jgi:hypothetical protein
MAMPNIGARRCLLLLCAVLAIVVAGVQIHLIGPEGGLTVSWASALISIALAGAFMALGLMPSKVKREPLPAAADAATGNASGVDPSARDIKALCSSQLDDYFAGIKGEMNQVDRLVGDAVGNLVASFKYIGKLTRSQHEISHAIAQAAAPGSGGQTVQLLERQAVLADQIEQEVDAAVTSLQFGDLVAQLLNHTLSRVEALGTALERIDRQDAEQESGKPAWKPRRIHEGISRAVMAANAVSRAKPVVQHGMQRGEVELF